MSNGYFGGRRRRGTQQGRRTWAGKGAVLCSPLLSSCWKRKYFLNWGKADEKLITVHSWRGAFSEITHLQPESSSPSNNPAKSVYSLPLKYHGQKSPLHLIDASVCGGGDGGDNRKWNPFTSVACWVQLSGFYTRYPVLPAVAQVHTEDCDGDKRVSQWGCQPAKTWADPLLGDVIRSVMPCLPLLPWCSYYVCLCCWVREQQKICVLDFLDRQ